MPWSEFPADRSRLVGLGYRLLIEGQRTNGIRNPRAEGTAGAAPTNWSLTNATAQGISRDIIGVQTVGGVQGFVQRLYGTATAQTNIDTIFESATVIAATQGEAWSQSQFVAVLAGSLAGFTVIRARAIPYIGVSSGTTQVGPNLVSSLAPNGSLRRFAHTTALPDAGTTSVQPRFTVTVAAGATVDLTLFLGWPQLERGAFASTPILPPVGTPGASTRGADLVTGPLALPGMPFTLLMRAVLPQAAPAGASQLLAQAHAGSDLAPCIRNLAGSNTIQLVDGASGNTANLGAMTPGVPFSLGMVVDPSASSLRGVTSGGTVSALALTGAAPTTLSIGARPNGLEAMFGEIATVIVIARALPNDELLTRVTALT